jgi:hypothetical protein
MNNAEPLTEDEIITLSSVFVGSIFGFFIIYEITYWLYERYSRDESPESVCLLEYKRWTP